MDHPRRWGLGAQLRAKLWCFVSPMELFDLIQLHDPDIQPERCKLHLAVWNGRHDPLDVYRAGGFERWQSFQSQRNFSRPLVVALIALRQRYEWLFAGAYDVLGVGPNAKGRGYVYETSERGTVEALAGRLVVRFERTGRQSYLVASKWAHALEVVEYLPRRMTVEKFPGYAKVRLSKQQLDTIITQSDPTWHGALSSVGGVYVIADTKTGNLYVGSATGDGGIWRRWCDYARTGHGGNAELRAILRRKGKDYAANFQFGVLETADTKASEADILARESHWKELLLSRAFGYNRN